MSLRNAFTPYCFQDQREKLLDYLKEEGAQGLSNFIDMFITRRPKTNKF